MEPSRVTSEIQHHRYPNHIQDIVNIRNRAVLAQRADGKPVTAVTITVAEDNIVCWTANRQAIIAVVDHIVLE